MWSGPSVRITPVGKLANRPDKDWKGDFILVDAKGSSLAKRPGSLARGTGWQLRRHVSLSAGNAKLKLEDGEYAIVLTLRGPGIEQDYSEDAPFLVFGAGNSADSADSHGHRR